jgi:hypothetical protein
VFIAKAMLGNDTDVDGDTLNCQRARRSGRHMAIGNVVFTDGQLQRPGQLHLHRH